VRSECKDFRAALEAELLGRPSQAKLAGLSWHAHLLSCGECRDLLEKEEALETLLASLPEPRLPEALARRVLSRLREDRATEVRLDTLLELDDEVRAPESLAADLLVRLASERSQSAVAAEARLDALLDRDRRIEIPPGLAARVLAVVAQERAAPLAPAASRSSRPARARRSWLFAAAAGLLLVVLGRALWMRVRSERGPGSELVARSDAAPDPQMLAALDVLEEWDLLMQDDMDVLLSTLGPADEALLDYP
jgi:hypothetical protein